MNPDPYLYGVALGRVRREKSGCGSKGCFWIWGRVWINLLVSDRDISKKWPQVSITWQLHYRACAMTYHLICATATSTLSMRDIEPKLRAIINPYLLGVYLEIPTEDLDLFRANHPNNVTQQKTDVINYWLQNSEDISWDALARAVERMGGHGNVVSRLRKLAKGGSNQESEQGMDSCIFSTLPVLNLASIHAMRFLTGDWGLDS